MLSIYNTLKGEKVLFKPLVDNHVGIYVCGITAYDYCHIGHARSMIIFDVIVRYLRMQGLEVTYVRNITDIDDKIIKRAKENNETVTELTTRFIGEMHADVQALKLLPPDREPRATEFIPQIIEVVQQLLDREFAYIADDGDVWFAVHKFSEYGKLSRRDLEKLRSGIRISINDSKRDPLDFVLWKHAKPGEPQWDSPWGPGRPGWHIECSAMAVNLLGQPFDIHGGGMDLKFPHHENEIAQSECAVGKGFANNWLHVGLLQINKEKMSKSLGNFFTIREILEAYNVETLRYFMIASHYRSPVNYSAENMEQMRQSLETLYGSFRGLTVKDEVVIDDSYLQKFCEKMNDDFNTPEALAVLFDIAHDINRCRDNNELDKATMLAATLRKLGGILGILQHDADSFLQGNVSDETVSKVEQLIKDREQARQEKNWQQADELRDQLTAMGVAIEDTAGGTIWRKV